MAEISKEFVKDQVKEIKDRDDVKAVAIFGSYAREPEGKHRDLDIYIIVDGNRRKRVTEEVDDVVVEKFFNSKEWSEHYLDRAEDNNDWAYPYRYFHSPDVRYDPEKIFEELKKKAEDLKETKFGEDFNEEKFLYSIWDYQQDIQAEEDIAQKRYLMNQFFDYLLGKAFELNKELPVKENYSLKKLKHFDGYMYKLSQEFLLSSSTMEKEEKLDKIVEHVTRGMGEPDPELETDREKFER